MREGDGAVLDARVVVGVVEHLGGAVGVHLVEGVDHLHAAVVLLALQCVDKTAHGVAALCVARAVIDVVNGKWTQPWCPSLQPVCFFEAGMEAVIHFEPLK